MVIFEIITGITFISAIAGYQLTKKEEVLPIYGKYCICYTKDNSKTYIPWYNRSFKTEDEYEMETLKIVKLAFDEDEKYEKERKVLYSKGISGVAIVNLDSGEEEYWCAILI